MYESPEPDARSRFRGAPQVILAVSGVVVATVFAAIASLAAGSSADSGAPQPRKDIVNKDKLVFPTASSSSVSETPSVTDTTTSTTTGATTTTKKTTKVTTITRPDGTTTTVTTGPTTTTQDPAG